MKQAFVILTDHFQFNIADSELWKKVDVASLWKNTSGSVVEADGFIGVTTARYGGKTSVSIILDEQFELNNWKVLAESRLSLPSGKMLVWGPENTESGQVRAIEIPAGIYRVEILSKNTEKVVDEMAQEGEDEYAAVLHQL